MTPESQQTTSCPDIWLIPVIPVPPFRRILPPPLAARLVEMFEVVVPTLEKLCTKCNAWACACVVETNERCFTGYTLVKGGLRSVFLAISQDISHSARSQSLKVFCSAWLWSRADTSHFLGLGNIRGGCWHLRGWWNNPPIDSARGKGGLLRHQFPPQSRNFCISAMEIFGDSSCWTQLSKVKMPSWKAHRSFAMWQKSL